MASPAHIGQARDGTAALAAWVLYAGRRRRIPGWAIELTVETIPGWADEMLEAASDRGVGADPAKRFLAAAEDAGVELTDDRAVADFVAGWNAPSDAA